MVTSQRHYFLVFFFFWFFCFVKYSQCTGAFSIEFRLYTKYRLFTLNLIQTRTRIEQIENTKINQVCNHSRVNKRMFSHLRRKKKGKIFSIQLKPAILSDIRFNRIYTRIKANEIDNSTQTVSEVVFSTPVVECTDLERVLIHLTKPDFYVTAAIL